uniref:C3H1-type domain-containing protein n=1 Tax=Tetradesmus obliquus TaxID=3088 RepID=A0A383VML3_TETOB|eukprot:jgi/Sobl393_1/8087/SZX65656.1
MMGQRGRSDEEIVLFFKVFPCNKNYNHDFAACFNTHPGDKARRRCLLQHSYSAKMCPEMKNSGNCPRGDACHMTHSLYEYWLHPQRYRTKMCKDARGCNRLFCFFAHHESEIRLPSAAPQPLPSFSAILAKTGGEASSTMAAAVAAAADAAGCSQGLLCQPHMPHLPHVPAPPTPMKHADPAAQQVLLRQLSPPQQQQVLGLSFDNGSSSSLFRGCSDVIDAAALLMPMQLRDAGKRCSFEYSISEPGDASCSNSNSSNVLPVLELPPGLGCAYPANNSMACGSNNSPGSFSVAYMVDSVSPVPPLFVQGGIGGCMPPQQQQQQQQFLPAAGASSGVYQPQHQQQQQQLASMDPIALSAMLQRMSVTSPDMQLQQLQVPVSQPTQPALSSPAQLLQQQQVLMMPQQQQQQLLQLVSAPPAALAPPSAMMMPAAATGVRPQLLMPGAAGVGGGLMHVASPSGLQQQQQQQQLLPATGGFDVSALCGQHYTLQQLQW